MLFAGVGDANTHSTDTGLLKCQWSV